PYVAAAPGGTWAITPTSQSVPEGNAINPTVLYTVNFTRTANGNANIDYATGGGTATGGSSCGVGVDYISIPTTTHSTPNGNGATDSFTIAVTICADTVAESNETFNISLSN